VDIAAYSSYEGFKVDGIGALSTLIMQTRRPSTNLIKRAARTRCTAVSEARGGAELMLDSSQVVRVQWKLIMQFSRSLSLVCQQNTEVTGAQR
jgi:hypothetical protein